MLSEFSYKNDLKILIAVCLLFLSKNYYLFYDNNYITSNTILNTLLLLFLYFVIILNSNNKDIPLDDKVGKSN